MLISLNLIDIVSGYDEITHQERTLRQRWRQPLLENYAMRRSVYEKKLSAYQRSMRRRNLIFTIGLFLFLFLVVAGISSAVYFITSANAQQPVSNMLCMSPIICVGAIGVAILLGGAYIYLPSPTKPVPPLHPLKDHMENLFPELTRQWRQGLKNTDSLKQTDEGFAGERLLIEKLESIDTNHMILHRLVQKEGDDLDVVIIGERGVWLFEVKFWKGSILLEDGEWQQMKTFRGPGGQEKINRRQVDNHPDEQWRRMKDELTLTFDKHLPEYLSRDNGFRIHGGVLFAHPKSLIKIPKGSGFNWGNLSFWINVYTNTPSDPIFSNERNALLVVEALLHRHQQVVANLPYVSMKDYADQLVKSADEQISSYCTSTS